MMTIDDSLKKMSEALDDLKRLTSRKKVRSRYSVKRAKKVLESKLRCGFLKPHDVTIYTVMYSQDGFTEDEAEEIINYLIKEGLLNGERN